MHIPGLLQTEGPVRAIFEGSVPRLSEEALETRVEFRLRRQRALEGVRYLAAFTEAFPRRRHRSPAARPSSSRPSRCPAGAASCCRP
ncbi:Scr1 family TA system antitoxin-like transcriptional regulator [Streptomyces scabiei]|uniref:Scr1 family TA system antitoxin-like transcriptional regulator n=1 Tax=Streptomyces scabiei TaxID=1930 RepID=UPI0036E2A56A